MTCDEPRVPHFIQSKINIVVSSLVVGCDLNNCRVRIGSFDFEAKQNIMIRDEGLHGAAATLSCKLIFQVKD